MEEHDIEPGSPEWHAHRAQHFNASDAPVMMGLSDQRSRNDLLAQMKSGISPEFSDYVLEHVIEPGHEFEALARPLAEEVLGEDLYVMVGSQGRLSASFDGINANNSIFWEHKRLNNELRAVMTGRATGADLPKKYQVQMEQGCMVSGAKRVLFTASDWNDEQLVEIHHVWYTSNPQLADEITAGWHQFEADLVTFEMPRARPAPVTAKVIKGLPALMVQVEGKVTANNLGPYREAASAYIGSINTVLKTDQDFADAENAIKFCQESEDRLTLVKEQTLSQTATIAEIFAAIDEISANFRDKRLLLTNATKTRKDEIKREIAEEAQAKLDAHVKTLNERLGTPWIPKRVAAFGEAMKNKRTVESLHSAVDNLLASEKIALSATADRLGINRKAVMDGDTDYFHLFADFATVGAKEISDFSAIALQRIAVERARLQKILDDKKAADDAAAAKKAAEDARIAAAVVPAAPVAAAPATLTAALEALPVVGKLESVGGAGSGQFSGSGPIFGGVVTRIKSDARPPLGTGELNALVGDGFSVSVPFITKLGFSPAPNPAGKHSGTYWHARDVVPILQAIQRHLQGVIDTYAGANVASR